MKDPSDGRSVTMEPKPPEKNLLRYASVGMEFFLVFGILFVGGPLAIRRNALAAR